MLASVVHVIPLTTIQRERILPAPGRVLVRKGQKVGAADIVAEASLNPEHLLLDIARGLGVRPDQADQYLQVKSGAQVMEGDVLAGPVGIARRLVRSPKNARVVVAGGHQVLLELESPPFELKAGISGTVSNLIEGLGVVVETTGALVQGVWGNNQIDYGLLNVLISDPDEVITADRLDVSLRGSILLVGHCCDPDVIKTAASLPVRGLVISSMDAALVSLANKMTFPILILEGFGRIPMNPAAYKLLKTSEQREAAVNASQWNRYTGVRPELVIQLPAPAATPALQDADIFKAGMHVRVIRAPYFGSTGMITRVIPGLEVLRNGLRAASAEVQFDNHEKVVLPLVNLEAFI